MSNLLRAIGVTVAIIGASTVNEYVSAEGKFYQERLSGYSEVTPAIREEAREYADKEAWEQFSTLERLGRVGFTLFGAWMAVFPYSSNKKKEEKSVESILRDGLPTR